jgi:hypothetical protein
MRVIINESRFDLIFSNWLEDEDIQLVYKVYPSRTNRYDELIVSGGFYLYKEGERVNQFPYTFSYKVGNDKQLIFWELSPPSVFLTYKNGLFRIFPSEHVKDFFVNKVRDFLQKRIDEKSIPI